GQLADQIPRMAGLHQVLYFLSTLVQPLVQVTPEIHLDNSGQIRRVTAPMQKSCSACDYILSKGTNVSGDDRGSKTIRQEQHATLGDAFIWQHQSIRCLEVQFCVLIWNKFELANDAISDVGPICCLQNLLAIFFAAFHWLAGDDQPVGRILGKNLLKCRQQVFETLIGRDSSKEKNCSFFFPDAQPPFRFRRSETRVFSNLIDSKRYDRNSLRSDAKIPAEFTLHLVRMNENVINEPILNLQSQMFDWRIARVPLVFINVVGS